MKRRTSIALFASAVAAFPTLAGAAGAPSGQPDKTEADFVAKISADLASRFPTPDAAKKERYFRYTDEDETGAISYTNLAWTSGDPAHPSQLWYDAKDRLIGADYSVPYVEGKPPHFFGVNPARWVKFGAHAHYALYGPNGTLVYGGVGQKTLAKVGGSVAHPTPSVLVAAGIAKRPEDFRFSFAFPAVWDLSVWVVPNPDGAFAEKNPNVKPVNPPKNMKM